MGRRDNRIDMSVGLPPVVLRRVGAKAAVRH